MMILQKNALKKLPLALCVLGFVGLLATPAQAELPEKIAAGELPEATNTAEANTADASASAEPAQPVKARLTQTFDAPETAEVGDRITLTLNVEHPEDTRVHLPETLPNPRWELVDTRQKMRVTEGNRHTALTLIFQIFRPGSTRLPAFDVTVLNPEGQLTTLQTEPVEVKIVSVLPADKTPPLKPARAPVAVWTDDYTLLWLGGGLGALALVGALSFLIARRRRPEDPGPPPRPAHVVALEKLSALTHGDLLDGGEYMLFYVRMSEAVREYLGRRYDFRGTELTTTEILEHLKKVESDEGWPAGISFVDVRDWLNFCDLIKFSDLVPARERSEQTLRQAFSLVELTRKKEPTPDTSEGASSSETAAESETVAETPTEEAANSASKHIAEPQEAAESAAVTEPDDNPDALPDNQEASDEETGETGDKEADDEETDEKEVSS